MLADEAVDPTVVLKADDFWRCIRQGYVAPYRPEAAAQNRIVIDVLARTADGYAQGGYGVIVDGIVGPWFLGRFCEALAVPLHYVVLRPNRRVTLERARSRGAGALTEAQPVGDMHAQFSRLGSFDAHTIDSTHHSTAETLDAVRSGIRAGIFRLRRPAASDVG